jgi:GntR family transcriptional regulator, transcriptional repressor for pyruvate dehydrogenase complex
MAGLTELNRTPRRKLSTRVVEAIRADLLAGSIPPGHKLPTEMQLTAQFGVSRTVVREAIAALAADGLVESRQGAGIFVTRHLTSTLGAMASEMGRRVSSALNVLEVRLAIEVESAALAAERRSPSQEAAIQEAFFEFEMLLRRDEPTGPADLAFHRAIAAATGNPSYLDVLDALGRRAIPCDISSPDSTEFVQDREYQMSLQREHLAILNAISARDSAGARAAMRAHLTNSQTRYSARMYERQANYATGITGED